MNSANVPSSEATQTDAPAVRPLAHRSFGPMQQIDAGVLNVGYVEVGPADGRAVILMHEYDPFTPAGTAQLTAISSPASTSTGARRAGHNVPPGAPHDFAQAVVDVDHF
jgi:hypothetical protein